MKKFLTLVCMNLLFTPVFATENVINDRYTFRTSSVKIYN